MNERAKTHKKQFQSECHAMLRPRDRNGKKQKVKKRVNDRIKEKKSKSSSSNHLVKAPVTRKGKKKEEEEQKGCKASAVTRTSTKKQTFYVSSLEEGRQNKKEKEDEEKDKQKENRKKIEKRVTRVFYFLSLRIWKVSG